MIERRGRAERELTEGSDGVTLASKGVLDSAGGERAVAFDGMRTLDVDVALPPPYRELGEVAVRKQLGLTAAAEKQLQGISMNYAKAAEKFSDEAFKLTCEERMRPEFCAQGRGHGQAGSSGG